MITAKDEFFFEREQFAELFELAEANGIDSDVVYEIIRRIDGEFDAGAVLKMMQEASRSPLERIRRGETLLQHQINKAVNQAANHE